MSKKNGWIPLDKEMIRTMSKIDRPWSFIEAMFSFTLDIENDKPWTIKGYAKLWGWSRNKVRKFVKESRTPQGHPGDTQGTQKGHPIHFIDKGLWDEEDTLRTHEGHLKDTPRTPTYNPLILNPKEKTNKCPHKEIINLYHSILPELTGIKVWNDARKRLLSARWKEDKERQSLSWWEDFFKKVKEQPFLLGDNDREWKADLEWCIRPTNFPKVLEGKYKSNGTNTHQPASETTKQDLIELRERMSRML